MKKTVLFLSLSVLSCQVYAQETLTIDRGAVAQDLNKEADSGNHDKKTAKLMRKVALEFKTLDDCDSCGDKSKQQIVVRNVGRRLGKASAWVSSTTAKPFLNAAGFLTGAFEKKEKNQDIVGLYKFFLNHSKEFDKLYLEASAPQELVELMLGKIDTIVKKKTHTILKDFLLDIGVKKEIPEDLADFELSKAEIAALDQDKITPDFINNHPEYQELKPIIGEVTDEELKDIIASGYLDKNISFENYKEAMPKLHEGAVAIVGQIFGPRIILGVISQSLVGIYTTPVIMADIGSAISTSICVKEKTIDRFETDKDLAQFCSYVVNRSAYELMKSRVRGYVSGKKMRVKLDKN